MLVRNKIAALILAAGKSQRFGSPKVLASFNGIPFLRRMRIQLQQAGITDLFLILGFQAERIIPQLPDSEHFNLVINPDYELGQFFSLRMGLQALPEEVDAVLMCLIDQPHIRAETYRALLQSSRENKNAVIIPTFQGKGGHPIVLPSSLFRAILAAPEHFTLRDVLAQNKGRTLRVEVNDAGILKDIDTPADLNRLERLFPDP